jgi:hypothetical protein
MPIPSTLDPISIPSTLDPIPLPSTLDPIVEGKGIGSNRIA